MPAEIQGFPLFQIVDFSYGCIKAFRPGDFISKAKGVSLEA